MTQLQLQIQSHGAPMLHIPLPKVNRLDFQQAAEQIELPVGQSVNEALLTVAHDLAVYFAPLLPWLRQLHQPDAPPYLVVSNLPIDRGLLAPPVDGQRPLQKRTVVSELTLLALAKASHLEPFSYLQEKGDTLVHEIAPIPGQEAARSNAGQVGLGWHTDNSILRRPYRPEYLMLLGLLNPGQVPTHLATLDVALSHLSQLNPDYLSVLQEPCFRIETPESFHVWNGKVIQSEKRPLLTAPGKEHWEMAGNLYSVKPQDEMAQAALDALIQVLDQVQQQIVLQPGMALIFNNHRCLHGRGAIDAPRWLQRIYCRHSLTELRQAAGAESDEHVFDIRYLILE